MSFGSLVFTIISCLCDMDVYKFVQAFENKSGGRYSSRTLNSIVCGLKRVNFCCLRETLCQCWK